MKHLKNWLHAHPLKAIAFTFAFTVLASIAAVTEGTIHGIALGTYFLVAVLFLGHYFHDDLARIIILLAACMALPTKAQELPLEQQKASGGAVVAIVVIVVGGVATYYLVKFCQKHFAPPPPRHTNDPPELSVTGSDDYAAASTFSAPGSCLPTLNALPPPPGPVGTCELGALIVSNAILTTNLYFYTPTQSLGWKEFNDRLIDYGIYLPQPGQTVYGKNGQSADASTVPINIAPGSLAIGSTNLRTVRLEYSTDLTNWLTVGTYNLPVGMTIRVESEAEDHMFYRWALLPLSESVP